ncbi:MAG: bifunctional 4-hydroxy-2-oxoglutarate aldolase/2-dehydro-3-deoxy-phosphogluconate aldolase [bacterium]
MIRQGILDCIRFERLIPVVRVATSKEAIDVSWALVKGGSHLIEITMTVDGALNAIRKLRREMGERVFVGAGTVINARMAEEALEAGAQFLVSPSLNMQVIAFAREAGVVVIPGAMTPTEILSAWEAGAHLVKVFPAGALGGPSYIKALKGPLPQVEMVPTGGVNLENAAEFIRAGAMAVGIGGELVDKASVAEGALDRITQKTREVLDALHNV